MNAPRMRRRYRTSSPRRGLLYLLIFVIMAACYVGQRVYAQRQRVLLGGMEHSIDNLEATLERLQAERDRLTSPTVLGVRAEALGLRAAQVTQLARVPLTLPEPLQEVEGPDRGLTGAWVKVWEWLDGPTVQKQEVMAAP